MKSATTIISEVSGLLPETIEQSYKWVIEAVREAQRDAVIACNEAAQSKGLYLHSLDSNSILEMLNQINKQ